MFSGEAILLNCLNCWNLKRRSIFASVYRVIFEKAKFSGAPLWVSASNIATSDMFSSGAPHFTPQQSTYGMLGRILQRSRPRKIDTPSECIERPQLCSEMNLLQWRSACMSSMAPTASLDPVKKGNMAGVIKMLFTHIICMCWHFRRNGAFSCRMTEFVQVSDKWLGGAILSLQQPLEPRSLCWLMDLVTSTQNFMFMVTCILIILYR